MTGEVEKIEISAEEKITVRGVGRLKGGKEIAAQFRMQKPGEKSVNKYVFTDGSESIVDDADKKATWPEV